MTPRRVNPFLLMPSLEGVNNIADVDRLGREALETMHQIPDDVDIDTEFDRELFDAYTGDDYV